MLEMSHPNLEIYKQILNEYLEEIDSVSIDLNSAKAIFWEIDDEN